MSGNDSFTRKRLFVLTFRCLPFIRLLVFIIIRNLALELVHGCGRRRRRAGVSQDASDGEASHGEVSLSDSILEYACLRANRNMSVFLFNY